MNKGFHSEKNSFFKKVQKLDIGTVSDYAFVNDDFDVSEILERLKHHPVEANFVDRCPGYSLKYELDAIEQKVEEAFVKASPIEKIKARNFAFKNRNAT